VALYSAHGNHQPSGDLPVGQARGGEGDDLAFPVGERQRARGRREGRGERALAALGQPPGIRRRRTRGGVLAAAPTALRTSSGSPGPASSAARGPFRVSLAATLVDTTPRGVSAGFRVAAFAPDGKTLAISGATVYLRDMATGQATAIASPEGCKFGQ
jgi:hypothetical protein